MLSFVTSSDARSLVIALPRSPPRGSSPLRSAARTGAAGKHAHLEVQSVTTRTRTVRAARTMSTLVFYFKFLGHLSGRGTSLSFQPSTPGSMPPAPVKPQGGSKCKVGRLRREAKQESSTVHVTPVPDGRALLLPRRWQVEPRSLRTRP